MPTCLDIVEQVADARDALSTAKATGHVEDLLTLADRIIDLIEDLQRAVIWACSYCRVTNSTERSVCRQCHKGKEP